MLLLLGNQVSPKSLLLLILLQDEAMSQQTCWIISALSYAGAWCCPSCEGRQGKHLAWKKAWGGLRGLLGSWLGKSFPGSGSLCTASRGKGKEVRGPLCTASGSPLSTCVGSLALGGQATCHTPPCPLLPSLTGSPPALRDVLLQPVRALPAMPALWPNPAGQQLQ